MHPNSRKPAFCPACGTRFSFQELAAAEYEFAQSQHDWQQLFEEYHLLLGVQELYEQFPEAKAGFKPYILRMLMSTDPVIQEKLASGVPLGEIELPDEEPDLPPEVEEMYAEVLDFLRSCDFELGPRLGFVSERMDWLKGALAKLPCTKCGAQRLELELPKQWGHTRYT